MSQFVARDTPELCPSVIARAQNEFAIFADGHRRWAVRMPESTEFLRTCRIPSVKFFPVSFVCHKRSQIGTAIHLTARQVFRSLSSIRELPPLRAVPVYKERLAARTENELVTVSDLCLRYLGRARNVPNLDYSVEMQNRQ